MNAEKITVRLERKDEALNAILKLIKKAERCGNTDIEFAVSAPYFVEEEHTNYFGRRIKVKVESIDFFVTGAAPKFGDFKFIATVEMTEGGAVVRSVPGETVHPRFREAHSICEHCNTKRERNDVFIVEEISSGLQKQIGRSCLREYTGIDDPKRVMARFAFIKALRGLGGGFTAPLMLTHDIIATTIAVVDNMGWCSAKTAEIENRTATRSYVSDLLHNHYEYTLTPQQADILYKYGEQESVHQKADAILAWVRDEMRTDSEFNHNLRVICSSDYLTNGRNFGIMVAAVMVYDRAMGYAAERAKKAQEAKDKSQFQGTVGERIRNVPVTVVMEKIIGETDEGFLRVLVKMVDEAGNHYVWFTNALRFEEGHKFNMSGTVFKHDEFNGVKQTILKRVASK